MAICHDRAPRRALQNITMGWNRHLNVDGYEDLCPRCARQLLALQNQKSGHGYNAKTKKVIRDAESGKNLLRFETAQEMFEDFDAIQQQGFKALGKLSEKPRG
jgi:hypothetical protein